MKGREKKGEEEERERGSEGEREGEKERRKEKLEIMCHLIGQEEVYTHTRGSIYLYNME